MREDKEMAIRLRREGKSYNEISKKLGIPKSTLSAWFRDRLFSEEIKAQLINEAKKKWAANITKYNKNRAALILEKAGKMQEMESRRVRNLSNRELWLIGTALYWAEGGRRERWRARFTNSDPNMIKFMMSYFRYICKVKEEKFRLLLQTHSNVSEENAKKYWHQITGIPTSQFHKTQVAISKTSKHKREARRLPYGTITISISDVNIVNRLQGWIKGLAVSFRLQGRYSFCSR